GRARARDSRPRRSSCAARRTRSFRRSGQKKWSADYPEASCGSFPVLGTPSTTLLRKNSCPPCGRSYTCERMMAKDVDYLADFDSATGMLRALAASLRGEGLPLLGAMSRSKAPLMKLVAAAVNRLPKMLQEQVYIWSGWME